MNLKDAISQYQSGKRAQAEQAARKLLCTDPHNSEAMHFLGPACLFATVKFPRYDIARMQDRSGLLTEQRLPESMQFDAISIEDALSLMSQQDFRAVAAVVEQRGAIARAIEVVSDALAREGRLIYVGAGTSGRLGVLDASECPPTFGTDPQQVQAIIAGGPQAVFRSQEGAEDRGEDGAAQIDQLGVGAKDVVLGIAAGGTTPFVLGALRRAHELRAKTIFLTCVSATSDEPPTDLVIRPLVGPELLTGSTRLKAGTATKLVLNAITTLSMVRLGKVYENLMVDLRATNQKLWDRGARIISTLTGLPREQALQLLRSADGQVKTAIVMQKLSVPADVARQRIAAAGGSLRKALG